MARVSLAPTLMDTLGASPQRCAAAGHGQHKQQRGEALPSSPVLWTPDLNTADLNSRAKQQRKAVSAILAASEIRFCSGCWWAGRPAATKRCFKEAV